MSNNKDKLEMVLEYLINGEADQADALLHTIVVDKARTIYEDLVDEEEDVAEDKDIEEEVDEAFGGNVKRKFVRDVKSDMDEIESDEIYDDSSEDDELAFDADLEADDEMGIDDEAEGDFGMEMGEELPIEDRVDDLESQLADLTAEFNQIIGDDSIEDELGDEFGDEEVGEFGDEEEIETEGYYESDEVDDDEEVVEEATKLQDVVSDPSMKKETGNDGKPSPIAKKPRKDHGGGPHKTGADGQGKLSSLHTQTSTKDDGFGAKDNINVDHSKGPTVDSKDQMDKSTDSTLNKLSDRQK